VIVPVRGTAAGVFPATAAISCAGVRAGSCGVAVAAATVIIDAVSAPVCNR